MTMQEEKRLLLQGINKLYRKLDSADLDTFQRYNNLINCLIELNWKECGKRSGEGYYIPPANI